MLSTAHIMDDIKFKKDEIFILADAGGATVDFSCQKLCDKYEDITDYQTQEIYHPTGGHGVVVILMINLQDYWMIYSVNNGWMNLENNHRL